jgi:hypothetical protein
MGIDLREGKRAEERAEGGREGRRENIKIL